MSEETPPVRAPDDDLGQLEDLLIGLTRSYLRTAPLHGGEQKHLLALVNRIEKRRNHPPQTR